MIDGSKSSVKKAVLSALRNCSGINLAIVFGSVAAGAGREDSDIDIAVDAGRRLTSAEKMALISEIAAHTGRPVDLVDLQTAGEPLLGQILRHGARILGGNTSYANLIRKHLFDNADFMPYRDRILQVRRRRWTEK